MAKMKTIRVIKITTVILLIIVLTATAFSLKIASRLYRYYKGVKKDVTLEDIPMEGKLASEVRRQVEKMAEVIYSPPYNARFDKRNMEIIKEENGLMVDITATVDAVMSAKEGEKVKLAIITLEPELIADIFNSINKQIAFFSTSGGGSVGRTDNLYVAARYMNGTILAPGDIFSFNKVTGPRTFERGYSMAPVVGGMGIGGGVCQVATTIYNAALIAGLEILERHPHSIRVGYVPPGRDATITNYIDLKFRNSTEKFIQIRSGAGGGYVWVELLSQ